MARIQVKQVSDSMQRMILGIVLLATHHLVPSTNAQTLVPADPAEVNTWFKAAIKPLRWFSAFSFILSTSYVRLPKRILSK